MSLPDDYECIKSHLSVLTQQIYTTREDITKLQELKEIALSDPLNFIQNINSFKIPHLQKVCLIPSVSTSKFSLDENNTSNNIQELYKQLSYIQSDLYCPKFETVTAATFGLSKLPTSISFEMENRKIRNSCDIDFAFPSRPPSSLSHLSNSNSSSLTTSRSGTPFRNTSVAMNSVSPTVPLRTQSLTYTPSNFNTISSFGTKRKRNRTTVTPWTQEEHSTLIQLLSAFPPETIQKNRIRKIAAALGTRSVSQITARLHNLASRGKLDKEFGEALISFQDFGNGADYSTDSSDCSDGEINTNDESTLSKNSNSANNKKRTIIVNGNNLGTVEHIGYKCDGCGMEPIKGIRFHCCVCYGIDLCSKCKSTFSLDNHTPSHLMNPITQPEVTSDTVMGEYAYLDSSYNPT